MRLAAIEPDRFVALSLTVTINLFAVWLLTLNALSLRPEDISPNFHATLFGTSDVARAPPSQPQLLTPSDPSPQPPEIPVDADASPAATVSSAAMSQMLAPRPDPQHVNVPPEVPSSPGRVAANISIILRIFVKPDGSVADANIAKSSGDKHLDELAIAYVEQNWRFIPAMVSGAPIADWTTVLVPFKS